MAKLWNIKSVMDVVVVGCGASGVAALRTLHAAGLKVLGLEAAGRIGGRIRTEPFASGVVDLGAQWCHGEEDNATYELVKDAGVLGRSDPEERTFVQSDGRILPADSAEDFVRDLKASLDKADKRNKLSIPEFLRKAVKEKKVSLQETELAQPLLEWFERNNHVGGQGDPERSKSLHGLEEEWTCKGEFLLNWKDRGYQTLLDIMLNSYPNPEDKIPVEILLNKEVETIKWKGSNPDVESPNPLVQVTCRDGSLYEAKCVIVTVSVGVLQERHNQMFNPPLPAEKTNAINNLQMCVLDKIYIRFNRPWWTKSPSCFALVWRSEDKTKLSEDEWWLSQIFAFSTVEHQPNVLCTWIYGLGAEVMERASLKAVRRDVAKVLAMFFERNFSLTDIEEIKRSQWAREPLARGSYSHRCVATEARGGGAAVLAEPLCHDRSLPKVCFAGEATSLHHHGAVHGAVEAGIREARRIIEHMNA